MVVLQIHLINLATHSWSPRYLKILVNVSVHCTFTNQLMSKHIPKRSQVTHYYQWFSLCYFFKIAESSRSSDLNTEYWYIHQHFLTFISFSLFMSTCTANRLVDLNLIFCYVDRLYQRPVLKFCKIYVTHSPSVEWTAYHSRRIRQAWWIGWRRWQTELFFWESRCRHCSMGTEQIPRNQVIMGLQTHLQNS